MSLLSENEDSMPLRKANKLFEKDAGNKVRVKAMEQMAKSQLQSTDSEGVKKSRRGQGDVVQLLAKKLKVNQILERKS